MIYFIGKRKENKFEEIQEVSINKLFTYFTNHKEIGFDTETTGFDSYTTELLSYQLGDGENQFVIDHNYFPINSPKMKELLENTILLAHNYKFDGQFCYHQGVVPTKIWDTYLAEAVLNKGKPFVRKSLDETVHRYCRLRLNKHLRGRIIHEGFSDRVIKYAAEDTKYLIEIKEKQSVILSENNLSRSMYLENEFVKVLAYTEYSGIYLDKNKWSKKMAKDNNKYKSIKESLNQWIIDNNFSKYINNQLDLFDSKKHCLINWSSPKQVIPLFQELGINTEVTDDKTGKLKDSVDVLVIEPQVEKSSLLPIYLKYKKLQKAVSTYGQNFLDQINPVTGRIHSTFTQIMVTGRMSSGNKKQKKVNLQNIPADKETRNCFTAQKSNILINADYNGQEQIIFANWTQDKDILEFYKKDLGDMHAHIASKLFPELANVSLKDIKIIHKKRRQEAKSAGFAINYGGNGTTIAENLRISVEKGEDLYNAYFKAFPGVKKYFKEVAKKALKLGYIQFNNVTFSKSFIPYFEEFKEIEEKVNNSGFWDFYRREKAKDSELFLTKLKPLVRKYFKKRGDIERASYNYPIQGSGAEVVKIACIYIFNKLIEKDLLFKVFFSNIVHDEILLETPEEYAKELAKDVKIAMEKAGNLFCKTVKLTADPQISLVWKH